MEYVLIALGIAGATALSFWLSTIPLRRATDAYLERMRRLQERASSEVVAPVQKHSAGYRALDPTGLQDEPPERVL